MNKQNENTERLTDKAFLRLVLSSIFGLLMCLFCLCSTTWAWFSDNAPSRHNEIKTAEKCLVSVSVSKEETIGTANINTPFEKNLASGEYTVTMTLPKDSASFVKKVDKINVLNPNQVEDYDAYKINFRMYYDLIVKNSRKGTIFALA